MFFCIALDFRYICQKNNCDVKMIYNFDKIVERHGTDSLKFDDLLSRYGRTDLTPLWVADMDFEVCQEITAALKQRLDHRIYGYSCADEGYWQSIIDWERNMHGFEIDRSELTYIPGVVKGIGFAINHFTRQGDKVVIQEPVYHPFRIVPEGNGRQVISNDLILKDGRHDMDLEGLEAIFKDEKPRMMILCNPHNPMGVTWAPETLRQVARLAKQYGVIVVSDEIHGDLALFGHKHHPFATVSDEAAEVSITLGAPSKTFNIPGIVSSWCVVKNPALRQSFYGWLEANEFNDTNFLSTVATEAAYKCGSEWLDQAKAYIERNIIAVEEFCAAELPQIKPMRPEASFLVWLDCSELNLDHAGLIDLFVNKAGLALNDGEMFGMNGACHMRLNVATPRKVLMGAMQKLKAAIL